MKKHISYLILTALLPLGLWAQGTPVQGTLKLNGRNIAAEYTINGSNASLGSGRNACIPQYSMGSIVVPKTITVDGNTYNVTAVSAMALRLCSGITYMELPEGVTRIGDFAFKSCRGLVSVSLPSTLQSIGTGAFIGLPSLKSINCNAQVPPRWEYNDVFCRHEGGIGCTRTYSNSEVMLYVPIGKADDYRNSAFSDTSLGWITPDGWRYFTNVKEYNDYETDLELGISTPLALNRFRERVNRGETFRGRVVKVEADIDMANEEWSMGIGGDQYPFLGTFDGQGHIISNLKVNVADRNSNLANLGFFNHVVNCTITNLRLDQIHVISQSECTNKAGVVAGLANSSMFSNIYVSNSSVQSFGSVGGLVGKTFKVDFEKCVADNITANHSNNGVRGAAGGLLGEAAPATIRNCAVIKSNKPTFDSQSCIKGPFVGVGNADIDYCYTDATEYEGFVPNEENQYVHGEHVVVLGQEIWVSFMRRYVPITTGHMKNLMYLMPFLGLQDWVYCVGEYPLPDSFEDLYKVEVNRFNLRPATLTTPRPNALTPTEDITDDAWLMNSYRNAKFRTSSLWIDDNLDVDDWKHVPIGTATIDCTNGIRYERTLAAAGNVPAAYCFFLPYPLTFTNGIRLYQPTEVKAVDDEMAHAAFVMKDDLQAEAWTPYYAVVDAPEVSLSTEEHTVLHPLANQAIDVGDGYFFEGTAAKVSRQKKDAYLLQDDSTWRKAGNDILPFRSYFYSTNDNQVACITTKSVLILKDGEDNNDVINNNLALTTNVKLQDRTLYKNDVWNTLCLPFSLDNLEGTPLEGASVKTLSASALSMDTHTLTLTFSDASSIEAGKPYVVKWTSAGSTDDTGIENPVFENVTISNAVCPIVTDVASFVGIYRPLCIGEEGDMTLLYLGDNNLYYPNGKMSINAFRAYFQLPEGITLGDPNAAEGISQFVLNFDDEKTGVPHVLQPLTSGQWYTLDGRKLKGRPSAKGVYINNGNKVVMK